MHVPTLLPLKNRMNEEAQVVQDRDAALKAQVRQLEGQSTQVALLRAVPAGQVAMQEPLIRMLDEFAHERHS